MIELILPPAVRSAETRDDVADDTMMPGEPEVVARAVPKRRAEFATVRHCARSALAELGVPAAPILPGERNAPVWPDGIVGSMTHCPGYRAAAVARAGEIAGVGIDAESHGPLPDGVLSLVSLPPERTHLEELADGHPGLHWDRLLFSAKESVYKVWFPQAREWLDFSEAHLTFDPDGGTFTAEILRPGPFTLLNGRFLVAGDLVLTAITLPA
jgi:4'-phosphopantetheinyl transferase EntD